MKKLVLILSLSSLFSCKTLQAQPPQKEGGIGSVKTEAINQWCCRIYWYNTSTHPIVKDWY